jgi:hypothetical protein
MRIPGHTGHPIRNYIGHLIRSESATQSGIIPESLADLPGIRTVCSAVVGTIAFGIASYRYAPLRDAVWNAPPNPIYLCIFVLTLNAAFLSHGLLRPVTNQLFAERHGYYTERKSNGGLRMHYVQEAKESIL